MLLSGLVSMSELFELYVGALFTPGLVCAREAPRRDQACRRARDRQGRCAPLARWPEDGPSLTAAVRDGPGVCRSGRKDGADRTKGWNESVGVDMVDFPLPLPVRCIVSGKRKWHYFCDHHLSWSADRAKTAFVLLCFAHHIACIKFSLTIPDLFVYNWCRAVVGHLR